MSKNQNKFIQHQLMLSGSIIDNCKIKYVLSHMFNLQYQLEYYNYIKFYNILKKTKIYVSIKILNYTLILIQHATNTLHLTQQGLKSTYQKFVINTLL